MDGIVRCFGLRKEELLELNALRQLVEQHDGLIMKLNWNMLETRSDLEANDFIYRADGKIVGFLGMYSLIRNEAELSGLVHPEYRRKGIFTSLFQEGVMECKKRGIPNLLLICPRSSEAAKGWAESRGGSYAHSEYEMECFAAPNRELASAGPVIRRVAGSDEHDTAELDTVCFGGDFEDNLARMKERMADADRSIFVASMNGKVIGKVGIIYPERYIGGLAVHPEFRGRGYGRVLLEYAVHKLREEKAERVVLEVACDNEGALALYKSCGFTPTTVYDYYRITL